GSVTQAFVAGKIEELVLQNLAAGCRPELILTERRLRRRAAGINIVEEILGIQGIIAKEVVSRAVEGVRSALGDRVDLCGAPAELRAVGIRLHLEFLNLVDRRD